VTRHLAAAAIVFTTLLGCARVRVTQGPPITHVVVCWLKNPGDETARQRLIDTSKSLSSIPGLRSVRVGTTVPGDRPQVESSFDVALVMEFEDEAALRAYETHPTHQRAVREVLQPLAARFIVYDFENR
jgi:hypothetical protein